MPDPLPVDIQVLRTDVDGYTNATIIALHEGTVIGQAKVWMGEPELTDLFVERDYRRNGVGRQILQRALELVRLHPRPLRLYYLPDSPGRPLFEAAGFVDTGERGVDEHPEYIWAAFDPLADLRVRQYPQAMEEGARGI